MPHGPQENIATPTESTEPQPTDAFIKKAIGLYEYIIFTVGGFCVGALQIAGVVDIQLAIFLIICLALSVIIRSALHEWVSSKSRQRVVKTTFFTGLVVTVVFGTIVTGVNTYKVKQDKKNAENERLLAEQRERIEFQSAANSKLKTLTLLIKFDRLYSRAELGHYRIFFSVTNKIGSNNESFEMTAGCQEDLNNSGIYQTLSHIWTPSEMADVKNTANLHSIKIEPYNTTNVIECSFFDLGERMSDMTINDFDKKLIPVTVTDTLNEKIKNISFIANNYILFSHDSVLFDVRNQGNDDTYWFLRLSEEQKKFQWKSIGLKPTGNTLTASKKLDKTLKQMFKNKIDAPFFSFDIDFFRSTPRRLQQTDK